MERIPKGRGVAPDRAVAAPAAHARALGFTLVEMVVAIAIVGLAVVFIVGGMKVLVQGANVHRQAVTLDTVMRDYAESLKLAPQARVSAVPPQPWCTSSAYSVSYTPPSGYTVSQAPASCPATTSTIPQFQTVTLTGTAPNNGGQQTLRVTVRSP